MTSIRVLLAGESWLSNSTHLKGWDYYTSNLYETGIDYLKQSLENTNISFQHLPNHLAPSEFPMTMEKLAEYDLIFLSDVGANSRLLHPDTYVRGKSTPNRLALLREWVHAGRGLAMCGNYYSFAGIYGNAKYYRTPN